MGDFGLMRDVYFHLYYLASKYSKIPVRWSAPEMLQDCISNEKMDVVSVIVAEIACSEHNQFLTT